MIRVATVALVRTTPRRTDETLFCEANALQYVWSDDAEADDAANVLNLGAANSAGWRKIGYQTNETTTAEIADLAVTTGKLAANAVTTGKLAALAVTAAEIAVGAVTTTKLGDASITPDKIAPTAVAMGSEGVTHSHIFDIADGVTADYDVVMTQKFEVIAITVQKRAAAGAAANTVQVKKAAAAISDVMSINVADKLLVYPAEIDDAASTLNVGDTLRVSVVKVGGNAACLVCVQGLIRP